MPAKRFGYGCGAVGRPEFLEDVLEVGLDGVRGDEQLVRDVLVGVSERKELEDLDLPGRQRLRLPVPLLGLGQFVGQCHHQLRVDDHVAARHQPDRLDEMFSVPSLEDVAPGSRSHGLHDELSVVVGREHDHADLGVALLDLSGRLQTVHLGHPDVQQHDVGFAATVLHEPQHFASVGRFSHHLDVARHLQVSTQPLTDQRVVVGNDYLDRHICSIGPNRVSL